MPASKPAEKVQEEVEKEPELPMFIETPVPTPSEEIVEPLPPTTEEIHKAILLLATLQLQAEECVSEGDPGDVFLCYDLSLRIRGEEPVRVRGMRCMHRILLPEGLASATTEMESTIFTVVQPLKQSLLAKIGQITSNNKGSAPRPALPNYNA